MSERKLKQARKVKKASPEKHAQVVAGELSLADAVREISRAEIVAKLEDVVKVKRLVADVDRPL